MFELILGLGSQILLPIIVIIGGLIGFVFYGAKKKADGRAQERERARKAGDAAAEQAQRIRDNAATKPMSQRREEFTKWEK